MFSQLITVATQVCPENTSPDLQNVNYILPSTQKCQVVTPNRLVNSFTVYGSQESQVITPSQAVNALTVSGSQENQVTPSHPVNALTVSSSQQSQVVTSSQAVNALTVPATQENQMVTTISPVNTVTSNFYPGNITENPELPRFSNNLLNTEINLQKQLLTPKLF